MKKKIFAVSDIHNNYEALITALDEAKFDADNEQHLLIVLGDEFDRQPGQALILYEYLRELENKGRAIILKGNHCQMLQNYLDGTTISAFNYINNGTDETLADFLHETKPFESWCTIYEHIDYPTNADFARWLEMARKGINDEFPELLPWLKERPYYYETENYIFTHGMIQGDCDDWKHPAIGWHDCTWAKPSDFNNSIVNTDKTIVVGHINCGLLRGMYGLDSNDNSIFVRPDKKVISIDTCTPLTKKVNVLVIDDENLA